MRIKAKRGEFREMRVDVNGKVIEIKIYEAKICVYAEYTLRHTNNSKHRMEITEIQRVLLKVFDTVVELKGFN
jgi:hypothetical protein